MYPEEEKRSQVLGVLLGSMALGVLVGYPFGGILYAFSGKSAPFYILAILTLSVLALELLYLDLHCTKRTEVNLSSNLIQSNVSNTIFLLGLRSKY